jgi:hypothetical protein
VRCADPDESMEPAVAARLALPCHNVLPFPSPW